MPVSLGLFFYYANIMSSERVILSKIVHFSIERCKHLLAHFIHKQCQRFGEICTLSALRKIDQNSKMNERNVSDVDAPLKFQAQKFLLKINFHRSKAKHIVTLCRCLLPSHYKKNTPKKIGNLLIIVESGGWKPTNKNNIIYYIIVKLPQTTLRLQCDCITTKVNGVTWGVFL